MLLPVPQAGKQDSEANKTTPLKFVGNFPKAAERRGRKVKVSKRAKPYNKYNA